MKKRKREFTLNELLPKITKGTGFRNAENTAHIRAFLKEYLDSSLLREIQQVELSQGILTLRISSPLLRQDLRLRNEFFLTKFRSLPGLHGLKELRIL